MKKVPDTFNYAAGGCTIFWDRLDYCHRTEKIMSYDRLDGKSHSRESGTICYLCGDPIERNPKDDSMKLSLDHVPPRQFYPKGIRENENLNL